MTRPILKAICATLALATLTACVSLSPEEEAQAAEQVAGTVVSRVYPGINVNAMANCVRENATAAELSALASYRDTVVGSDAQILTLRIVDRPETNTCARANGIILN